MQERSPMALSCPAPKHCEYGRTMASSSLGSARNPTPVSEIQFLRPLQNGGLEGKTNYVIAAGLLQHSPRRITSLIYSLLRDQEVACSQTFSRSCKLWWARWPGPGGPVPVARSRSRFKGACPRARAKKDLFCCLRLCTSPRLEPYTFAQGWRPKSQNTRASQDPSPPYATWANDNNLIRPYPTLWFT